MPDLKPPRLAGDDRAVLCGRLRYQGESFVRKLRGVDDEAARSSLVGSGTTLLWLAQHMAEAEQTCIVRRFAGETVPEELLAEHASLDEAIAAYERTTDLVDEIVASRPSLDALCHDDDPPVNLRWILAHLLEETPAMPHVDILRDSSTARQDAERSASISRPALAVPHRTSSLHVAAASLW